VRNASCGVGLGMSPTEECVEEVRGGTEESVASAHTTRGYMTKHKN